MADQLETTPLRQLNAAPYYLPNLIAAIAASVGVVVGSVGPWASLAWVTANGASASAWWQGKTTLALGAVAGIALFTLLNRGRTGSGTRWLAPLAWIAPVAGLVSLLIAIISIVNVISTSHQLVGLQVEWGLWVVAISSVVLCVTASVAAAQVGTVTEGSQAWMRTAIVISALILLGITLFFSIRVPNPQPPQSTISPTPTTSDSPRTETSTTTVTQPSPTPGQPRGRGDLGLPQPISQPACNGQGIVILGSVTTPGLYPAGVQRLLDAHPGAFYLRTDQTCPSLRQATAEGNPIYAVFKPGGTTHSQVCAAVTAAGGWPAYGKWLDLTTDPGYIIPC